MESTVRAVKSLRCMIDTHQCVTLEGCIESGMRILYRMSRIDDPEATGASTSKRGDISKFQPYQKPSTAP